VKYLLIAKFEKRSSMEAFKSVRNYYSLRNIPSLRCAVFEVLASIDVPSI
jgi:hypothetical protein